MSSPSWLDSLRAFWRAGDFDPAGGSFVVGLSGGADSVALLELFVREIAPSAGCKVFAVHVNHRLRSDAGLDQVFVEELCAERGVPLHVETLDPATRGRGQSVEMWARERRYAAFARAAARFGAGGILTAHHRDDVAETVALRLWRGTGIAGLAGVPFRRAGGLVRPLLPLPRAELVAWLRALGTPWREESTNLDLRIPRNWVRHRLLPDWRVEDPDVDARLFRIARETAELLPAWEKWTRAEHPVEEVAARGGIPVEWLRAGVDATTLRALLRATGVADPAPELASELLRQAGSGAARIRARADQATLLTEKNGVLVAKRSIFERPTRP
jgi:tRNA(Ile)-lysidine synthetase-like protein